MTDDIGARLQRAVHNLEELCGRRNVGSLEYARLAGKIEGVKLAATYLDEDERVFFGQVS